MANDYSYSTGGVIRNAAKTSSTTQTSTTSSSPPTPSTYQGTTTVLSSEGTPITQVEKRKYNPNLDVTTDQSGKIIGKGNLTAGYQIAAEGGSRQSQLQYVSPGTTLYAYQEGKVNPMTGTPWGTGLASTQPTIPTQPTVSTQPTLPTQKTNQTEYLGVPGKYVELSPGKTIFVPAGEPIQPRSPQIGTQIDPTFLTSGTTTPIEWTDLLLYGGPLSSRFATGITGATSTILKSTGKIIPEITKPTQTIIQKTITPAIETIGKKIPYQTEASQIIQKIIPQTEKGFIQPIGKVIEKVAEKTTPTITKISESKIIQAIPTEATQLVKEEAKAIALRGTAIVLPTLAEETTALGLSITDQEATKNLAKIEAEFGGKQETAGQLYRSTETTAFSTPGYYNIGLLPFDFPILGKKPENGIQGEIGKQQGLLGEFYAQVVPGAKSTIFSPFYDIYKGETISMFMQSETYRSLTPKQQEDVVRVFGTKTVLAPQFATLGSTIANEMASNIQGAAETKVTYNLFGGRLGKGTREIPFPVIKSIRSRDIASFGVFGGGVMSASFAEGATQQIYSDVASYQKQDVDKIIKSGAYGVLTGTTFQGVGGALIQRAGEKGILESATSTIAQGLTKKQSRELTKELVEKRIGGVTNLYFTGLGTSLDFPGEALGDIPMARGPTKIFFKDSGKINIPIRTFTPTFVQVGSGAVKTVGESGVSYVNQGVDLTGVSPGVTAFVQSSDKVASAQNVLSPVDVEPPSNVEPPVNVEPPIQTGTIVETGSETQAQADVSSNIFANVDTTAQTNVSTYSFTPQYLLPLVFGSGGETDKGPAGGIFFPQQKTSKRSKGLFQIKSDFFRKFAFGEKDILVSEKNVGLIKSVRSKQGSFLGFVPTQELLNSKESRKFKGLKLI